MSKYPLLDNEHELKHKYLEEKLSTLEISKIIGSPSPFSVTCALRKFSIPIRNRSEGKLYKTTDSIIDNREFIDGSLLGDGSLRVSNKQSDICQPSFNKKNKHKDHLEWFASHIDSNAKIKFIKTFIETEKGEIKEREIYTYSSNSSARLKSYYKRWYNTERKIIPCDLKLSPNTVLNWFLDDGFSTYRDRTNEKTPLGNYCKQHTNQILLVLCSQSFLREENEFLVELLKKQGIDSSVGKIKNGTGSHIVVKQRKIKEFFEYIGECPVNNLKYKWKL